MFHCDEGDAVLIELLITTVRKCQNSQNDQVTVEILRQLCKVHGKLYLVYLHCKAEISVFHTYTLYSIYTLYFWPPLIAIFTFNFISIREK